MVEQFGLAMMPRVFHCAMSCGLHSGTTSGTSASILKWLVLSMTTAPLAAANLAYFSDTDPPALKNAISISCSSKTVSVSSTTLWLLPLNSIWVPALFALASGSSSPTGKSTSSITRKSSSPTAPVAPTTATLNFLIFGSFLFLAFYFSVGKAALRQTYLA